MAGRRAFVLGGLFLLSAAAAWWSLPDRPEPKPADSIPLEITFSGDGRRQLIADILNPGASEAILGLRAGEVFVSGSSRMLLLRGNRVVLAAGQRHSVTLPAAALSVENILQPAIYTRSGTSEPRLAKLISALPANPGLTTDAIQTAVLAIAENLPVEAFLKIPRAEDDLPRRLDTSAYVVEVRDILAALVLLRGIGEESLALAQDKQFQIEAMVDPDAHAMAMVYYRIAPEQEWAYWKRELLEGDPATRHYALFGIGRFFPEVALQMLPEWARNKRVGEPFRRAAVQALGATRCPEALVLLRELERDQSLRDTVRRTLAVAGGCDPGPGSEGPAAKAKLTPQF